MGYMMTHPLNLLDIARQQHTELVHEAEGRRFHRAQRRSRRRSDVDGTGIRRSPPEAER